MGQVNQLFIDTTTLNNSIFLIGTLKNLVTNIYNVHSYLLFIQVLVKTKNKTYTISDYDELFEAMGFPLASKVLKSVPPAWDPAPPGVKMYCYHGENVQTMDVLTYKEGYFPDNLPDITYGNGDGTVNSRSLEACRTWLDNPDVDIVYKTFDGATHNGILGNTDLIKELKHTLFS